MQKKWLKNVSEETLKKMISQKISSSYKRPSFLDTLAEQVITVSKRSACLFYDVGAIIFKGDQVLSFGYNGPSKGDTHCYEVGCARIINGELKEGSGRCRGSHAELNAIGNAAKNGVNIEGANMMLTISPCKVCAKQIVNQGIKEVYYIFSYDRDKDVESYLRRLGVKIIRYEYKSASQPISKNKY
jgi:dCMP deaminase